MCDSTAHSSLMGGRVGGGGGGVEGVDEELFELRVCVSTPLLIVSPSINFTSYYWINLFGGGQSRRESGGIVHVCVCVCVCPLPHPSTPLTTTTTTPLSLYRTASPSRVIPGMR